MSTHLMQILPHWSGFWWYKTLILVPPSEKWFEWGYIKNPKWTLRWRFTCKEFIKEVIQRTSKGVGTRLERGNTSKGGMSSKVLGGQPQPGCTGEPWSAIYTSELSHPGSGTRGQLIINRLGGGQRKKMQSPRHFWFLIHAGSGPLARGQS